MQTARSARRVEHGFSHARNISDDSMPWLNAIEGRDACDADYLLSCCSGLFDELLNGCGNFFNGVIDDSLDILRHKPTARCLHTRAGLTGTG